MSTDHYKPKDDIPDLYRILGLTKEICSEPNCNELIQKAYIKKAKICHPDKYPGRKEVEEVFELLTNSYDILKDEKQREAYNHKLDLNKQSSSDFFKLRRGAEDYVKSIGEFKPASDQQKLSFKDQMRLLDSKHGYDSAMICPIDKQDAKNKMNNMSKSRASQDVELKPERLFDDGIFDLATFNAAFDKMHRKDDGSIIPHNGVPSPWNDCGKYSCFDNLDHLYVDDPNRLDTASQPYASVDFGPPSQKITKEDMKNMPRADYVTQHNIIGDDYYRDMKSKLLERKTDSTSFNGMNYNDFKRDDTAGYGIFDQLNLKYEDTLCLDANEENISKKFEKLMAERQLGQGRPTRGPR